MPNCPYCEAQLKEISTPEGSEGTHYVCQECGHHAKTSPENPKELVRLD